MEDSLRTEHTTEEWTRVAAKLRGISLRPGEKETVASGLAALMVQSLIETGVVNRVAADAYERSRSIGKWSSSSGAYRNVDYIAKCYIMDAGRQVGLRIQFKEKY